MKSFIEQNAICVTQKLLLNTYFSGPFSNQQFSYTAKRVEEIYCLITLVVTVRAYFKGVFFKVNMLYIINHTLYLVLV